MTRKPKWRRAPRFSQATRCSGSRGERQKSKARRAEGMRTSWAQRWRATENRFGTTTGIQSHKPAPSAAATRRHLRERRGEKEHFESIRSGRTGVCRCSGELTGQEMKGGPGRRKSAWVCGPLSLGETRLAGWSALPLYVSPARWRLPHQSISVSKKLKATVYLHPPRHSPHKNTRLWVVEPTSHVKWGHWASPSHLLTLLLLPSPAIIFAFSLLDRCFSESLLLTLHLRSQFSLCCPQLLEAFRLPSGNPCRSPLNCCVWGLHGALKNL